MVGRMLRAGRERLTLRQLRADHDALLRKLGKETRELMAAGEISHPGLKSAISRIEALEERIALAEREAREAGAPTDDSP
jgi:hypothetical protein